MKEKYVKAEPIIEWIDDICEDYVDSIHDMIIEERQSGAWYRDRIKTEAYEEFLGKLHHLREMVMLLKGLKGVYIDDGKEED